MIGVDTNVLVRLFVDDDQAQTNRAEKIFASDDVFIAKTVLLETEWVLRFSYGFSRTSIWAAFDRLRSSPTVTLEDGPGVSRAIDAHGTGMDFADSLHVCGGNGIDKFVTFDKKLARHAVRAKLTTPVQVL